MGYAFCTDTGGLYAGIKLLTPDSVVQYAIDNITGGGGGVDIYSNGYTTAQKYTTLSTNRLQAGLNGPGDDICDVVSAGPFQITGGDEIRVAFALLVDSTLQGLQLSADSAQARYNSIPVTPVTASFSLSSNYPNPADKTTDIHFSLPASGTALLEIYNALGQKVTMPVNTTLAQGNYDVSIDVSHWNAGIYFYRLFINGYSETGKMMVAHY
jgi:hypothetical protein